VLDFGKDALFDTMEHLDSYGILHAGTGQTIAEAEQARFIEKNGINIGFLSYTSIIPRDSWIADEEAPGVAPLKPEYYDRLLDNIEKADSECDVLIIKTSPSFIASAISSS
jgi:poly-gamma-glutamate capsule biosynthesis protein CapA/YwtB (metallophosphatase superfamily)